MSKLEPLLFLRKDLLEIIEVRIKNIIEHYRFGFKSVRMENNQSYLILTLKMILENLNQNHITIVTFTNLVKIFVTLNSDLIFDRINKLIVIITDEEGKK